MYLEKRLYLAVKFAEKMINDGMDYGLAYYKAGKYYNYSASEVAIAKKNQYKIDEETRYKSNLAKLLELRNNMKNKQINNSYEENNR